MQYMNDAEKAEHIALIEERNKPIIAHNNSLENLLDNKPKTISLSAKKRIINAVNWFYILSKDKDFQYMPTKGKNKGLKCKGKFRLNMITLTLCADELHDDKYIKSEMLEAFIRKLKDKHGLKTYIWRAEIQEKKTQRIHFHITTNIYVPHELCRKYWNSIQKKHGYIDAYIKNGGNENPNGTDVHSVRKVRKLAAYICKYMAKDTSKGMREIQGRQWYLSSNLSKIDPILIEGSDYQLENELVSLVGDKWKHLDYASIAYIDIFTKDLTNYPTLKYLKEKAITDYSPLIN